MSGKSRDLAIAPLRARLNALMGMLDNHDVAIVRAAPEACRSRDITWPYRQDSNFHYLCGFPEPHAWLVLLPGRKSGEVILFCREKHIRKEHLYGSFIGPLQAAQSYPVDDAFPLEDIDDILPGMLEGRHKVYYHLGEDQSLDQQISLWLARVHDLRGGDIGPHELCDLGWLLNDLRLVKEADELALMHKAAEVAVKAHGALPALIKAKQKEYVLAATFAYAVHMHRAKLAFMPTVAAGQHACTAHYQGRDGVLEEGQLVLIDAGAEVDMYASDVSRTYPVSGCFNDAQRTLYELVWVAQQAAFDAIFPGNSIADVHTRALTVLCQGLLDAGLLEGSLDDVLDTASYQRFYPYKTSHWLGLDVHDVGDYVIDGQARVLEPGMVLTVEPGLYIQPDDTRVAAKWRGIGIRIEDDVRVTRDGFDLLTGHLPSEASSIEALLAMHR